MSERLKNLKVSEVRVLALEQLKSEYGTGPVNVKDAAKFLEETHGTKRPYWFEWNELKVDKGIFQPPYCLLDHPVGTDVDREEILSSLDSDVEELGLPDISLDSDVDEVVEHGTFDPSPILKKTKKVEEPVEVEPEVTDHAVSFIPEVDKDYVKFGNYKHIEQIIKSEIFYPVFVTGLSGNGKTFSVEQACAKLGRELVRVNVTIETDEDDLLGGFRLIDGNTEFHEGPVVDAMVRGAVLLLDEVDLASNKILALQPVLEGKGVYLKKINKWIRPAKGFNVIATANTKGKGSESGSFIGTNILNEAFLERFAITLEQEYPPVATEVKIVKNVFAKNDIEDDDFAKHLVDWADIIRKTYDDGGTDEVISTRRLVHIANAYKIFGMDKKLAIDLCIARFDEDTKVTFNELYTKVDADISLLEDAEEPSDTDKSFF